MYIAAGAIKRSAPIDPQAEPPPKVARYAPTSTPHHSKYSPAPSRACLPSIKHGSHPNSRSGTSFHYVPYPLNLLPFPSWYTLHHHHLTHMSTDLQTVCPVCAKTRSAPSHHQKLFLVAERLLSDPQSTPLAAREKTEELNWKVNYKLGILDPAVEEPGIIPGGLHSQTHFYYPFESEFEMRAALKLLEKATVLSEGGWRIWLDMVDHLPVESSSASSPPSNESCREQQTQTQGRGVPPLSTAPSSSLTVPLTSSKNANISKPAIASLQEVEELDMTGDAAQSVTQIKPSNPFAGLAQPSVTSGPEFAKQRNTKIRTLQDFYQLLDLIERTSYCSARFLEAYAEFLRGDLCSECWLRHNILLGDSAEASAPHVKQASNASLSKHGLPSSRNVVGPPPLIEHSSIGGYHKHSIPSTQGPEWKRKGLLSTFRGH